jgi:hypothetical protein
MVYQKDAREEPSHRNKNCERSDGHFSASLGRCRASTTLSSRFLTSSFDFALSLAGSAAAECMSGVCLRLHGSSLSSRGSRQPSRLQPEPPRPKRKRLSHIFLGDLGELVRSSCRSVPRLSAAGEIKISRSLGLLNRSWQLLITVPLPTSTSQETAGWGTARKIRLQRTDKRICGTGSRYSDQFAHDQ